MSQFFCTQTSNFKFQGEALKYFNISSNINFIVPLPSGDYIGQFKIYNEEDDNVGDVKWNIKIVSDVKNTF